jgi:hypothetical protein
MGHEIPNMSSAYRETISDARLKAVADHVHDWLFPPAKNVQETGLRADDGDTRRQES